MNAGLAAFLPDAADVDSLVGIAMRLAGMIHIEDSAEMWELADGLALDQFRMVLGVLAAMVDIDKSPDELLGWAGYKPPRRLRGVAAVAPPSVLTPDPGKRVRYAQCGTQRGWESHVDKGGDPCDECLIAHEVWDRRLQPPAKPRTVRPATVEVQAELPMPCEPPTPCELHARFVALRKDGVPKSQIASHIRAGETEYQRISKADRVARRRAEQEETSAA